MGPLPLSFSFLFLFWTALERYGLLTPRLLFLKMFTVQIRPEALFFFKVRYDAWPSEKKVNIQKHFFVQGVFARGAF